MRSPADSLRYSLADVEATVARAPLGILTDVDGTISEIAYSRQQAVVTPEARRLLASLCKKAAVVAAVSGRPAREVEKMVGVEGVLYFGNHGLESKQGGRSRVVLPGVKRARRDISEVLEGLRQSLGALPGLFFEDKGVGAAIHYRQSPEPGEVARRLLDEAERLALPRGLAVRAGRMVVEIRPSEASKGSVVTRLVRRFRLGAAIYLGDDDTDVDAFEALHSLEGRKGFRGLAVAVRSQESQEHLLAAADLHLDGVDGVVEFLKWLDGTLSGLGRSGPPSGGRASASGPPPL